MPTYSRLNAIRSRSSQLLFCGATAAVLLTSAHVSAAPTLTGWASLPALTTAPGPTSGQFAAAGFGDNGKLLPLLNAQPVQGLSAVLDGPRPGTYYVMCDNGFGSKPNSADALLRVFAVRPEWKTWNGKAVVGTGAVTPVDYRNGKRLPSFTTDSFISLSDPDHRLGFKLQADFEHYYDTATHPAVDPAIKAGRLLTGADLDIESVRRDKRGNLWFGEEFGPFLVKTDKTGRVLRAEIPLPNFKPAGSNSTGDVVRSPQNPYLSGAENLGSSRGFEGMAINGSRTKLYTLLEGTVIGDAAQSLRINEFDLSREVYTGKSFLYALDALGTNIGDMTAVNDHQFLVLERNGNTATTAGAPYKRVFLIDIEQVDANGYVKKTDLVDLMNVADPHDLNADGSTTFTFPYVTIEDVLVVDENTLLVINDNNFPGGGGRNAAPDITEFLLIRLDAALDDRHEGDGRDRD